MTHYFQLHLNNIAGLYIAMRPLLILLHGLCSLLIQCGSYMNFIDNFDMPIHSM